MADDTAPPRAASISEAVDERLDALLEWLRENAPYIGYEQKHLDAGSAERAYWLHGYAAALQDIKNCLPGKDDKQVEGGAFRHG
jgi:hypothetical protein